MTRAALINFPKLKQHPKIQDGDGFLRSRQPRPIKMVSGTLGQRQRRVF